LWEKNSNVKNDIGAETEKDPQICIEKKKHETHRDSKIQLRSMTKL
jgi:hypothetical protein